MRVAAILSGLMLSLAAGAAFACPQTGQCGDRYGPPPAYDQRYEDRYEDGYAQSPYDEPAYEDDRYWGGGVDAPGAWEDERGLYIRGYRGSSCGCADEGMILSSGFFDGAGGVGPIPDGGYYGGGYYYVAQGGRASSHAFSSASARASASVGVRHRGGYGHRSHGGHGKHH